MREPWKVLFYHLQSHRSTTHNYSYGVSVLHPVHAVMHLTHVLPRWMPAYLSWVLPREPVLHQ